MSKPKVPNYTELSGKQQALIHTALGLVAQLEDRKRLYDQLDNIIEELRSTGFTLCDVRASQERPGLDLRVSMVDNFAEKNVCFRNTGVRHFEIVVEDLEDALKRERRKAKAQERMTKKLSSLEDREEDGQC